MVLTHSNVVLFNRITYVGFKEHTLLNRLSTAAFHIDTSFHLISCHCPLHADNLLNSFHAVFTEQ